MRQLTGASESLAVGPSVAQQVGPALADDTGGKNGPVASFFPPTVAG